MTKRYDRQTYSSEDYMRREDRSTRVRAAMSVNADLTCNTADSKGSATDKERFYNADSQRRRKRWRIASYIACVCGCILLCCGACVTCGLLPQGNFASDASQSQATAASASDEDTTSNAVSSDSALDASTSSSSASSGSDSAQVAADTKDAGAQTDSAHATQQASASSSSSASHISSDDARTIVVSLRVVASSVGKGVFYSGMLTLPAHASVYDALRATGLTLNARSTSFGIYIAAVGGLAEKEHGAQSGWKYAVNGNDPSVACSAYALASGDSVVWRYVTSLDG